MFDDRTNIGPYKPLPRETITITSPPSVHELADAVRELLAAMDDPRHNTVWADIGGGVNVMDKRAKVESILSRV